MSPGCRTPDDAPHRSAPRRSDRRRIRLRPPARAAAPHPGPPPASACAPDAPAARPACARTGPAATSARAWSTRRWTEASKSSSGPAPAVPRAPRPDRRAGRSPPATPRPTPTAAHTKEHRLGHPEIIPALAAMSRTDTRKIRIEDLTSYTASLGTTIFASSAITVAHKEVQEALPETGVQGTGVTPLNRPDAAIFPVHDG